MSNITLSPVRRQMLAGTAAAVLIAGFAPFPRMQPTYDGKLTEEQMSALAAFIVASTSAAR